ncbi:thiolase family protein [Nitratireductor soli]|uniref:thiolase family protein n=1 Tax=Nitratireductor soli TaxID=1670619 RepID=UPI00065E3665|nr:thiolase family protein [Nitratireductor soli]
MSGRIVIGSYARTPFGKFGGALKSLSGPELGAFIIDAVLDRSGITAADVEAAYFGVGMIGGGMLTPTRQAVLRSRLPQETPSLAVDRACCSGMSAIGLAYKDIKAGEAGLLMAGGFESLSRTPQLLPRAREKQVGRLTVDDPLLMRGEVVEASIAGYTAREALRNGIDRAMQDEWALASHERYFAADARGFFDAERVAVPVGNGMMAKDEAPRADTSPDKLAALSPVYDSETVTPGNAPGLSDGAAGLLVASEARARDLGLRAEAIIHGYVQVCDGPTSGSYTPAIAIRRLLDRHGLSLDDIALIEINEAFAATPLVSTHRLADGEAGLAEKLRRRTNIHGGAVAIGHPLGASGARLAMTLASALRARGGGFGIAAICGGFGQGDAILLEVAG